jgi:hypothetical protein
MANDLTGDFDVVAEFAIPAANRVIAAMHRAERFLHAMSVRVDDTRRRPDHRADFPTLVASMDSLGEPSVQPRSHSNTSHPFRLAVHRARDHHASTRS